MSVKVSLRERKKRATRAALIATARRLFAKRGYDNVTLEEICDEVPIHTTTFFSYFGSKEELAFAYQLDALDAFRVLLRDRSPEDDVLRLWWDYRENFGQKERGEESTVLVQMDHVPVLRSRQANIVRQYVEEISRALAEEAGDGLIDQLHAQLYASAMMAVHLAGAQWFAARFGDEIETVDTAAFAKLIMSKFPSREEIAAEFQRVRKAAQIRRGEIGKNASPDVARPKKKAAGKKTAGRPRTVPERKTKKGEI
jgi:AcrR family transcriptional regulator